MFKNRPAVKVLVPYAAGVIIGGIFSVPLGVSLAATVVCCVIGGLIVLWRRDSGYFTVSWLSVLVCFGVLKVTYDSYLPEARMIENIAGGAHQIVRLRGMIRQVSRSDADRESIVVAVDSIWSPGYSGPVNGDILVNCYGLQEGTRSWAGRFTRGSTHYFAGKLEEIPEARNPHGFNERSYMFHDGVYAELQAYGAAAIQNAVARAWEQPSMFSKVEDYVALTVENYVGGEEGKVIARILVSDRVLFRRDVEDALIDSNLLHAVTLSGIKIGIALLFLLALFRMLRFPEQAVLIFTISGIWFYGLVNGAHAPIMRAVVIGTTYVVGRLLQRKTEYYNLLAVAALALMMYDSVDLFSSEFQMTFAAVLGIVVLYEKFKKMQPNLPKMMRIGFIADYVVIPIVVSTGAIIGTMPLTIFYFQKCSIIGAVSGILGIPIACCILGAGFAMAIASLASPWLASVYAGLARVLGAMMLKLAFLASSVPYASTEFEIGVLGAIALYAFLAAIVSANKHNIAKRIVFAGLLGINCLVFNSIAQSGVRHLQVTVFDVGQGDAILIRFPDGKTALVDGGPITPVSNAGSSVLLPYFRHEGIHKLDYVFLTHPHSDHVGGLPAVLRNVNVAEAIDAGNVPGIHAGSEYYKLLDSLRVHRTIDSASENVSGERARIYVLHPSGQFVPATSSGRPNLNDQSLVLKIQYDSTSILLCGDVEGVAEDRILSAYGPFLKSDVLKVGHHGSATSSSLEFIRAVSPSFAVISVGKDNRFGHPSQQTLQRLRAANCTTMETDHGGAVQLESDGKRWTKVDWR